MANSDGEADERRRSLKPLAAPLPLYRCATAGWSIGAVVSLVVAAVTTLTLPLAVRRMIDHGFSASDSTFIANYFAMLVVIAAVLAAGLGLPLLFRHHARRARRRRHPPRRLPPCHHAVARLLRHGAVGRDRLAADRRHDADQVGRRRHGFGGAAQRHPRPRRGGDDGRSPARSCRAWSSPRSR